jgi:hypothetical protein
MKRLLDEPSDEVTWLLIRAGANHQPPRTGKLRLLASLGLGSVIGLSAREALAWLGTGSGKIGLAVTVLGASAGGVYALAGAPAAEVPRPGPSTPALVVTAPPAPAVLPPVLPSAAPSAVTAVSSAAHDEAPVEREQAEPRAPARRRAARAAEAPMADAVPTDSVPMADELPSPALSARRLTEETLWVDRLRVAAERGDRAGFLLLQQGYTQQFPEGQLRPEVNRLREAL